MDYNKLIVVDFDDTLCLHGEDKSNIAVGQPNWPLIIELNRLEDEGYIIHIYTARGHISAESRKAADQKYRGIITEWLNIYNVKHHKLSFEKPLAFLYIDDRAIRPNEIDKLTKLTSKN